MSKKHFIALADALKANYPINPVSTPKDHKLAKIYQIKQWEYDVSAIADVCQAQNPRFNRERWLGYIRGENGPNGER